MEDGLYNIKMDLTQNCVDWVNLAEDRGHWWAVRQHECAVKFRGMRVIYRLDKGLIASQKTYVSIFLAHICRLV